MAKNVLLSKKEELFLMKS